MVLLGFPYGFFSMWFFGGLVGFFANGFYVLVGSFGLRVLVGFYGVFCDDLMVLLLVSLGRCLRWFIVGRSVFGCFLSFGALSALYRFGGWFETLVISVQILVSLQ